MYSKQQLEYSDLILSTIYNNGGRMMESDVYDVLDGKYGEETVDPALQMESLIITEGLIVRDGSYLVLTEKGKKGAKDGFAKFLKKQELLDRVRENKDIVSFAVGIGTAIGYILTLFAQCT